jgi:hypothetical protein
LDFIADSDEEPEVDDSDDLLERLDEGAEQTTDQLRKEKEVSPSKTQKSLPKARKSSPKVMRASFKARMPSSMAVSQPKKTKRVARKKRKASIYSFYLFPCLNILHQRSTPDSFIEDDSSVGEASYADSEETDAPG